MRRNGINTCGCLPQCNDQRFEPEISQASFPGRGFNSSRTFTRLTEKLNLEPDLQYFKLIHNQAISFVLLKSKVLLVNKPVTQQYGNPKNSLYVSLVC